MIALEIGKHRLFNQGISRASFSQPAEVVSHLGAVQAQDYQGALWSLGLRMKEPSQALIEQAVAGRSIIRTWPMRGTLHFVAAPDVRWMLKLLAPRIISRSSARQRQLQLDEPLFERSRRIIIRALEGGKRLTRAEIFKALEQGNISPEGQRGIHILGRLSQEGLLCFGPHAGKQPTFVLLEEWVPPGKNLAGEEALAELARRYFTGHGPATIQDLERWAGLKISDARKGLEMVKGHLRKEELNVQTYWFPESASGEFNLEPSVYLLPGFDEYILGYRDRTAVVEPRYSQKIVPGGNGMFMPTIISNGRVTGTWQRAIKKARLIITPVPFTGLSQAESRGFRAAAESYGRFMNMAVEVLEQPADK